MKFGERLTELRKKEGLSQEELGYKLNVTRQTVSKWELGQTTPEMDKLVELGKIFNISVDELVAETEATTNETAEKEVIQDAPVKEKSSSNKKAIIIVIAIVVIFVAVVIYIFTIPFRIFNKATDMLGEGLTSIVQEGFDEFDKFQDVLKNEISDGNNNDTDELFNEFNKYADELLEGFNDEYNKAKDEAKNEFRGEQDKVSNDEIDKIQNNILDIVSDMFNN